MGHNFFFRITSNLPKKSYPSKTTLLKRFQRNKTYDRSTNGDVLQTNGNKKSRIR
jgi:hypothetical protein